MIQMIFDRELTRLPIDSFYVTTYVFDNLISYRKFVFVIGLRPALPRSLRNKQAHVFTAVLDY